MIDRWPLNSKTEGSHVHNPGSHMYPYLRDSLEIRSSVGMLGSTTCATVDSHILRMKAIVGSNTTVWAGDEAWLSANAVNIIQPDPSSTRPKPTWMAITLS